MGVDIMNKNFSIILPGPCNAKCDFCFWKRNKNESTKFIDNLNENLLLLNKIITKISIFDDMDEMITYDLKKIAL